MKRINYIEENTAYLLTLYTPSYLYYIKYPNTFNRHWAYPGVIDKDDLYYFYTQFDFNKEIDNDQYYLFSQYKELNDISVLVFAYQWLLLDDAFATEIKDSLFILENEFETFILNYFFIKETILSESMLKLAISKSDEIKEIEIKYNTQFPYIRHENKKRILTCLDKNKIDINKSIVEILNECNRLPLCNFNDLKNYIRNNLQKIYDDIDREEQELENKSQNVNSASSHSTFYDATDGQLGEMGEDGWTYLGID